MEYAPFEELEHPADLRLLVRGESLKELFENAARGMLELMLDLSTVTDADSKEMEAEGGDDESLLVDWLESILFAFDAEDFAPARVRVSELADGNVTGSVAGEHYDPERHDARADIKAVTWHDLEIKRVGGRYEVTIVFDV